MNTHSDIPDGTSIEDTTQRARNRVKRLAKALARQAKPPVQVVGAQSDDLAAALLRRGLDVIPCDGTRGAARTVIAFGTLTGCSPGDRKRRVAALWRNIPGDGVLMICERNADATPDATNGLSRRDLRDLLRPLGEDKLLSDQPFRWVAGTAQKGPRIMSDNRDRIEATAQLCRGRVLELGCGRGHLSHAIAQAGCDITGIELAQSKVDAAHSFYPDLDIRLADILRLPPDIGLFDTVVIAEVLEHVPSDTGRKMLDVAWACVAPGGRLIASTPYEDLVPHRNHLVEFTARGFHALLAHYGPPRLYDHQPMRWLLGSVEKTATRVEE